MYYIYDSLGYYLAKFKTYKAASEFKQARGNYNWEIRYENY